MDYNSVEYQEYLQRKRLERQQKLNGVSVDTEAPEPEPSTSLPPAIAAPVVMPALHRIKDAGGSGA